ncbi:MAG: four helix bundle protein [Bacteroidetes bacterium]|nr:four helix bundle protein [Bacteroidota bacterium]MBU1678633.1 four helix bundle protein [Bacteroidota bacterium]MBU2507763.1 four helix bundle protein [Bacteroidota bacterium]
MEKKNYRGFRDLIVYQLSYKLSVEIFEITKTFPKEEKYSLVDQIRRSSRSVPANISEAWSRRRYPKSFVNKLIESDGETSETTVWLDFSKDHKYISEEKHKYLISKYDEVGKMLSSMINQPGKFCH